MAPPGMQRKAPYNAKGRAASLQQQGKKRKRQVYALEDDETAARARITADGGDHLQASQVDLSNVDMIDPEETKRRKAEVRGFESEAQLDLGAGLTDAMYRLWDRHSAVSPNISA